MDRAVVARAQQGDQAAFTAIIERSQARLKQVAFRILRDRHLAEDATQQAYVDIWRKLPTLRDPDRFDAWSYRFVVRACYREAKRQRRSQLESLVGLAPTTDEVRAVDDREQLERAFARLSVDHRAVVVLHYYLDLSIEDTADALGISIGTAKSRLSRALRRLRLVMSPDAPEPDYRSQESAS